ncbi:UNVERIFIED_CONTAM: hypothetical protein Scaly_1467900 [Sesamum calycinum]|uniref:Uncharacterized protein n=1 Tax=Sesamum calycinum TaxID=2727403 RepID=A0AAW2PRQ6_9LAMI
MEMMHYQQLGRSSYKDSLKVLESDVQHANSLALAYAYLVIPCWAAAIPKAKGGARLQMKLVYKSLGSSFCFLLQFGLTVPARVFSQILQSLSHSHLQAVILPSLEQLHYDLVSCWKVKHDNLVPKSSGKKTGRNESSRVLDCHGHAILHDRFTSDQLVGILPVEALAAGDVSQLPATSFTAGFELPQSRTPLDSMHVSGMDSDGRCGTSVVIMVIELDDVNTGSPPVSGGSP